MVVADNVGMEGEAVRCVTVPNINKLRKVIEGSRYLYDCTL